MERDGALSPTSVIKKFPLNFVTTAVFYVFSTLKLFHMVNKQHVPGPWEMLHFSLHMGAMPPPTCPYNETPSIVTA